MNIVKEIAKTIIDKITKCMIVNWKFGKLSKIDKVIFLPRFTKKFKFKIFKNRYIPELVYGTPRTNIKGVIKANIFFPIKFIDKNNPENINKNAP